MRVKYQAPVSTKTPGFDIGVAGLMRLEEAAKKSSVWCKMRAPSGAEMRSVVVVENVWSI